MDYPKVEVTEGLARLTVPAGGSSRGPGTRSRLPFYNPAMAVNRDLTVLALRALCSGRLWDALTGSGALAARVGRECPGWTVTATDWNPAAVELARASLAANGAAGEVVHHNARKGPPAGTFTHVDIDPFGSPAPFLPAAFAVEGLRTMSVTATDTGALCGVFPEAALRRYGVRLVRTPCLREIGVRSLLGYCARVAADSSLAVRPLFATAAEHFLKVVFAVERGEPPPPRYFSLNELGQPMWAAEGYGPVWGGPLFDATWLRQVSVPPWMPHGTARLLDTMVGEADGPAFYWTTSHLAGKLRQAPPRLTDMIRRLRERGYGATRTHFDPSGFRTEAGLKAVADIFPGH